MLEIDFNSAVSFLVPFDKNYTELSTEIASIINAAKADSVVQQNNANEAAANTKAIFIKAAGAAALIVLTIGVFVGWGTTRSIRAIAGATRDLAQGDHNIDVA